MRLSYKFSNLCGAVYGNNGSSDKKGPGSGNLLFLPDGNSVLSPVGNRVIMFHLTEDWSRCLPFETRKNISKIAISPDAMFLIAVDVEGRAILFNLREMVTLHHITFKETVSDIKFSPDSRYIAVGIGSLIQIWECPRSDMVTFTPFQLVKTMGGHRDDVTSIEWSGNSKFLVSGSLDMTCRIYRVSVDSDDEANFTPKTLAAQRDVIVRAFFSASGEYIYVVTRDGMMIIWRWEKSQSRNVDEAEIEAGIESLLDDEDEEDNKEEENDHSIDDDDDDDDFVPVFSKGRYVLESKKVFRLVDGRQGQITCAYFNCVTNLLCVAFRDNGLFCLYEMPDFQLISTCSTGISTMTSSISKSPHHQEGESGQDNDEKISEMAGIESICCNGTGEWIGVASSRIGGLLMVWEWKSETFIIRQQGHQQQMLSSVAYSADGEWLASGGQDGQVKVWNSSTGFGVVTFRDHAASVTQVAFASGSSDMGKRHQRQSVLVSASLDGTVRAYDLLRYRNFRTFVTPRASCGLTSLAVDASGEIVCAGAGMLTGCETMLTAGSSGYGSDGTGFEIYIWSMQTGSLLDILSGHSGPVSGLSFSPDGMVLASGSWDKQVRLWDIYGSSEGQQDKDNGVVKKDGAIETIHLQSEVLTVAFSPVAGEATSTKTVCELAISCLDGEVSIWTSDEANDLQCRRSLANVRRAMAKGRQIGDLIAVNDTKWGNALRSLSYSADGRLVLGAGGVACRYLCLFDVSSGNVLRRYPISSNLSLDGMQKRLNSKLMTEAGALKHESTDSVFSVQDVAFSPMGDSFAVATSQGLVIYSNNRETGIGGSGSSSFFDPLNVDIDCTPEAIEKELDIIGCNSGGDSGNYLKVLLMAFRLGEKTLILKTWNAIPRTQVPQIALDWPVIYLARLLDLLADLLLSTSVQTDRAELLLIWVNAVLDSHARAIMNNGWLRSGIPGIRKPSAVASLRPILVKLEKGLKTIKSDCVLDVASKSISTIKYLNIVQSTLARSRIH